MANEKRLIDIEQAKRATYEEIFWSESDQAVVRNFLTKLPKVDAVEVVHGKWIKGKYPGEYTCSRCGMEYCEAEPTVKPYKYCPECGSKNE